MTTPSTEMQDTAMAMNAALAAHGYCQADIGLYSAFQKAAGLFVDGFPGRNTMVQLQSTVAFAGGTAANVTIYPWTADANGGGQAAYDGVNAPTWAQWTSCSGGPSVVPPVVPPKVLPPIPISPPPSSSGSGSGPLPYIIGAVVVAGALAAYTYSKKKRKH
jgi:hypothetical protein